MERCEALRAKLRRFEERRHWRSNTTSMAALSEDDGMSTVLHMDERVVPARLTANWTTLSLVGKLMDVLRIPTAVGVATRLAYERAKGAGLPTGPLLQGTDMTSQQIEDWNCRVPVLGQIEFLNQAALALDDPFLGFHLCERVDLRRIGLLYYALASSTAVMDALRRTERYSTIVNEGTPQRLIVNGDVGLVGQYRGFSRHLDRHQTEFNATAMLRMMRELTGVHLTPTHVRFVHIRGQAEPLGQFFGCEIEFGATADELIFPGSAASLPVVMADPYLNRLLLAYCEEAIAHSVAPRESFRCRVENALVPLLPHGMATAAHVADRLGVSQWTLARNLASEGLNFTDVIRDLRRALALRYLEEKNLTIAHIAWLLGYKKARAFSRAFESWTGDTPQVANPRLA